MSATQASTNVGRKGWATRPRQGAATEWPGDTTASDSHFLKRRFRSKGRFVDFSGIFRGFHSDATITATWRPRQNRAVQ